MSIQMTEGLVLEKVPFQITLSFSGRVPCLANVSVLGL
jgi:hypothetical protein